MLLYYFKDTVILTVAPFPSLVEYTHIILVDEFPKFDFEILK